MAISCFKTWRKVSAERDLVATKELLLKQTPNLGTSTNLIIWNWPKNLRNVGQSVWSLTEATLRNKTYNSQNICLSFNRTRIYLPKISPCLLRKGFLECLEANRCLCEWEWAKFENMIELFFFERWPLKHLLKLSILANDYVNNMSSKRNFNGKLVLLFHGSFNGECFWDRSEFVHFFFDVTRILHTFSSYMLNEKLLKIEFVNLLSKLYLLQWNVNEDMGIASKKKTDDFFKVAIIKSLFDF